MTEGDEIREHVRAILEEIPIASGVGALILTRVPESEVAWRLRSRRTGQVYLNGAGKSGRNDIEDFDRQVAIEVKYFLSAKSDGGLQPRGNSGSNNALEDWNWLIRTSDKGAPYARDWQRFWVSFFPQGEPGGNVQRAQIRRKAREGRYFFQSLISYGPGAGRTFTLAEYLPFAPFAGPVDLGTSGAKQKLAFLSESKPKALLRTGRTAVRCDLLGSPLEDSLWAAVYECVTDTEARELTAIGYESPGAAEVLETISEECSACSTPSSSSRIRG